MTCRQTMFPSRAEAWRDARAFIESFCGEAGIGRETGLRTSLVLEELFLNTVKHGHRGGSNAPIWIKLEDGDGRVKLVYEDIAAPFNPFARRPAAPASTLEERGEGGLGVILANALASSADYAYLYGRNRISLEVA